MNDMTKSDELLLDVNNIEVIYKTGDIITLAANQISDYF